MGKHEGRGLIDWLVIAFIVAFVLWAIAVGYGEYIDTHK
jgi:hypothetical protein